MARIRLPIQAAELRFPRRVAEFSLRERKELSRVAACLHGKEATEMAS